MPLTNKRRDRVYSPPSKEASDETRNAGSSKFMSKEFRYVL